MLDTIDLNEQLDRGNSLLQGGKKYNWIIGISAILIVLASFSIQYLLKQPLLGRIYEYRDGEVIELGDSFGTRQIVVDDSGIIWATNLGTGTLHRYDGASWASVENSGNPIIGVDRLETYENQLWVLRSNEVMFFDGNNWTRYDMPLPSTVRGFEVGEFGTALLDELGNLAILQDGEWEHQRVDDFLNFESYDDFSYLYMVSDGQRLFLSGIGMAVFDGDDWEYAAYYDGHSHVIGYDDKNIWLASYDETYLFSINKENWEFNYFEEELTGIPDSAWVWAMQYDTGRYIFATDEGFFEYTDGTWYPSPVQAVLNLDNTYGFALADNRLIIGFNEQNWEDSLPVRLLMAVMQLINLVLPMLILIPLLRRFLRYANDTQKRTELSRKRLLSLLPEMPEYASLQGETDTQKRRKTGLIIVLQGAGLGALMIFMNLQFKVDPLLICGAGFLLLFLWNLTKPLRNKNLDSENRAYLSRSIITSLLVTTVGSIIAIPTMVFASQFIWKLAPYTGTSIPLLLLIGLFVWLLPRALWFYVLLPRYYVMKPMFSGNFEESIRRVKRLRRIFPKDLNYLFQHGFILLEWGQVSEAEVIWRELLGEAQHSNTDFIAACLINLGNVLQRQNKGDESFKLFEAAVKIHPESAISYREMALWYLDSGISPERALELTEVMMHFNKEPHLNLMSERFMWACNLATHALALARNGQKDAALVSLERAIQGNERRNFVAQGVILNFAGDVHRSLNQHEEARSFYRQVLAMKPAFAVHRFAEKALIELDAPIA